jgi:hypothetical protein
MRNVLASDIGKEHVADPERDDLLNTVGRMKTSRAVIHRLLDADDPSVTLSTISRAAAALGRSVRVQLAMN